MPLLRLLQISDLHLGSPFGWLPADRRELRRREQQHALEAGIRLAIERGAHAILIPGDLFDGDAVDAETLAFAVHAFDVPGCPPTFIAPGNHDPWSDASTNWSPRLLRARGWAWPAHVHVFSTTGWSARPLPGTAARIWGRCFTAGSSAAERPLDPAALGSVAAGSDGELEVALFHGSHEGHSPPNQAAVAPFSDDELDRAPFAYLAVGHYHRPLRIARPEATGPRLAYAGSAVALDPTEVGVHGAFEVRLEYGGGPPRVEVEGLRLDPRRAHELSLEIGGLASASQIDRRIVQALGEAGVAEQDVVTVRLRGRLVRGVRYGGPGPELRERVFHARVDTRELRPDYNLEELRNGPSATTEQRFAQALLERLDAESDAEQRAIVEAALYHGLDAFRLRDVQPFPEEIGP